MCGIAGFVSRKPLAHAVLVEMTQAQIHRGPDESGFHSAPPFHGGMRRLSINDLAGGHQPLFNGDKSCVLFYNGEIYNYPALRRDLESRGHVFRTHCDGEVIAHLYDEVGDAVFEHLDGMFAAALWSERDQRLILARDLPGEKPLYYARLSDTEVAFASELDSLKRFPGLDLSLNLQAMWDFPTFLWVPEPATIYRHIHALPRGHMLVVDAGGIRLRPYGNRFNADPLPGLDDAAVVAETRRVVTEAVKSRLLSDVPLGAFLSGGLDSSIVATIAQGEVGNLSTFSIGFEDLSDPYHGRADESSQALDYARHLGTRHHTVRVTADTFRALLPDFCRHAGQPFGVSSGLGILCLAGAAREAGIKILLSGDGADELFGGYSWYGHLAGAAAAVPSARPAPFSFQNFGSTLDDRLAALAAMPGPERAWAWHYYAHENEKARLFNRDAFAEAAPSLRHFAAFRDDPAWQAEDFIRQDRAFYLPNEMLTKVDRMTMARSVEGRAPFVAPAVLAHAAKLPMNALVRGSTLKWALRQAFAPILSSDIVDRPKHGFNVPIDHWLSNEWADMVAATFAPSSALSRMGLLAPDAGRQAGALLADRDRLNGHTVFCYVMLNLWLETCHGNHR